MFTPIIPDGGGYADPIADPRKALDEQLRRQMAVKPPLMGNLYPMQDPTPAAQLPAEYGRASGPAGTIFLKNGTPDRSAPAAPAAAPAGVMGMAQPQGPSMLQDDLMRYHLSRAGGPPDMSGWTPQQRALYNQPMAQGGSVANQDQLLKAQLADKQMSLQERLAMMQMDREDKRYNNGIAREDALYTRGRKDAKTDRADEARLQTLNAALVAAANKGDYQTVARLQAAISGDQSMSDPNSPVSAAFAPTATEAAATSDAAAATAASGFDFNDGLRQLKSVAADVRNGRANPQDVVDIANVIQQKLIERRISPDQAKAMIGDQLDKELPGIGRDIMSGIQATVATPFRAVGSLFGGNVDAFENVGNASATRGALKQSGYLR